MSLLSSIQLNKLDVTVHGNKEASLEDLSNDTHVSNNTTQIP